MLLYVLPAAGRGEEARAIAAEALTVARTHGNPVWIAFALIGTGRAFADADPARALDAFRQALTVTQEQRIPFLEARVAQESAGLETIHGDRDQGLELLDTAIDAYHRAGNHVDLAVTLAELAVFFDRNAQPETCATIYGTSTHYVANGLGHEPRRRRGPPASGPRRRVFDGCVAAGAAMEPADAVRYARDQIRLARSTLGVSS